MSAPFPISGSSHLGNSPPRNKWDIVCASNHLTNVIWITILHPREQSDNEMTPPRAFIPSRLPG